MKDPTTGSSKAELDVVVWGNGPVGRATVELLRARFPSCRLSMVSRAVPRRGAFTDGARPRIVRGDRPEHRPDLAILCVEAARQAEAIAWCVASGVAFISPCDEPELLNDLIRYPQGTGIVGAGISPGLSTLLVRHAASWVETPTEAHIGCDVVAGSNCARQLRHLARAARFVTGSTPTVGHGKQLHVFPDPIGSVDCDPILSADTDELVRLIPSMERVVVRCRLDGSDPRFSPIAGAATWVQRSRRPRIGGVTVEVRGRDGHEATIALLGTVGPTDQLTAQVLVSAIPSLQAMKTETGPRVHSYGSCDEPCRLLGELERVDCRIERFLPLA